jgi:lipopolysaccharide biosynthesis glycosyltransferase
VLVLDLDWLRTRDLASQLLDVVRSRGEALLWVDQDALNLVLGVDWCELHPRWNAQNSLWRWPQLAADVFGARGAREATESPAILHFEGPSLAKPWHYLCAHPYRTAYLETAARTPWGPVQLADRTVATRLIAGLPNRWRIPAYVQLLATRERFRPSR